MSKNRIDIDVESRVVVFSVQKPLDIEATIIPVPFSVIMNIMAVILQNDAAMEEAGEEDTEAKSSLIVPGG